MMSTNNQPNDDYIPYIVKWGRITNLLGLILSFSPAVVLAIIFDLLPDFRYIIAGAVAIWSVVGVFWIIEPTSYFPVLGIPGTYMSFLSGNISNLRLPCSAIAQEAAGVEPGTNEGAVISTIGIGTSIIVNTIFVTIGAMIGAGLMTMLPSAAQSALNYILPALFGAIFAQFSLNQPYLAGIAICIGIGMTILQNHKLLSFLPGNPSYAVIIICVFGTILIGKKLFEKGIIR